MEGKICNLVLNNLLRITLRISSLSEDNPAKTNVSFSYTEEAVIQSLIEP
jgi:hypothetical protein